MAKKIPFEFVLDTLLPLEPVVKPMFGCHAVYVGVKIVLILRKRDDHTDSNGIWLATSKEHHKALKKIFPSMGSIPIFTDGKSESAWQLLPYDSDDFEPGAMKACELILNGDERIGRIPKPRKKKKA